MGPGVPLGDGTEREDQRRWLNSFPLCYWWLISNSACVINLMQKVSGQLRGPRKEGREGGGEGDKEGGGWMKQTHTPLTHTHTHTLALGKSIHCQVYFNIKEEPLITIAKYKQQLTEGVFFCYYLRKVPWHYDNMGCHFPPKLLHRQSLLCMQHLKYTCKPLQGCFFLTGAISQKPPMPEMIIMSCVYFREPLEAQVNKQEVSKLRNGHKELY